MPVHGKIFRVNPNATVGGMPVGSCGYVFAKEFQLSHNRLLVPLDADVFFTIEDAQDCFDYEMSIGYVALYRIDEDHDDESYIIDFNDNDSFESYPLLVDKDEDLDSSDCLIFHIDESFFSYEEVDGVENYLEVVEKKKSLKELLSEAVKNEDYEKAALIRNQIQKSKQKQTKGK
ncbi:MAG: UvrB/UvrC motif-containing protein [Candidatus Pacebacteria bacterium]|nr:UvrB/UvrC motif-containing protein [Candidatus Paceibacterota bacterium]